MYNPNTMSTLILTGVAFVFMENNRAPWDAVDRCHKTATLVYFLKGAREQNGGVCVRVHRFVCDPMTV